MKNEKQLNLYQVGDVFKCTLIKGGFEVAEIVDSKVVQKRGKASIQYSLKYSTGKVKHLSDAGISDRLKEGLWEKKEEEND